jgi:hypothetical protein
MRHLESKDVVRILHSESKIKTGVINRKCPTTGMYNIFLKGADFGIWFFEKNLKRIGRVK